LRKQNSRKQRIWRKQSLLLLKKRTLSVDVSNGEPKEVAYVAKLRKIREPWLTYRQLQKSLKQAVTKYRL
jgi:hypothetical protein